MLVAAAVEAPIRYVPLGGSISTMRARSRRRSRLRATAEPAGRPTAKATHSVAPGRYVTRTERWRDRTPRSRSAVNSLRVRTRPVRIAQGELDGQAERRRRPFWRRERMIARPARVDMRWRAADGGPLAVVR